MARIRKQGGLTGIIATLPGGKERAVHLVHDDHPEMPVGHIAPLTITHMVTLVPPKNGANTLVTNKLFEFAPFSLSPSKLTEGFVESCEEITAAYIKAGFDPDRIEYSIRPTTLAGKLRKLIGLRITG